METPKITTEWYLNLPQEDQDYLRTVAVLNTDIRLAVEPHQTVQYLNDNMHNIRVKTAINRMLTKYPLKED